LAFLSQLKRRIAIPIHNSKRKISPICSNLSYEQPRHSLLGLRSLSLPVALRQQGEPQHPQAQPFSAAESP
jgi:hypothetical protein